MSSQANQTDIDALTTRLMAGRYGELQSLRALAIVEKQAPNLAEQFERLSSCSRDARPAPPPSQLQQAQSDEQPSTEDETTPANAQAATVAEDLRRLSQSRRVSDLGAFRQRLERVFRSQPRPGGAVAERAPPRTADFQQASEAPQLGRPRPRRSASFSRPAPAPAPAPPPAAPRGGGTAGDDAAGDEGGDIVLTYETQRAFESMSAELHQLSADAVVEQRLADPRFLRQLERVISSRMSADDTRTGAERVARLRTLLARRRLQRPPTGAGDAAARAPPSRQQRAALQPRGPPHEVVTMGGAEDPLGTMAAHGHHVMNAAASIGGGGGGGAMASDVHNLRLVQGASFELLLSIQRTLQQEVAALSAQLQAQNNQHAPARGRGTGAAPAAAPPSSTTTAPQPAAVEDGDGVGEAILPARLPSALAPYDEGRPGSLGACVVCCEADVNTLFYQCGHLCSCARCAHMLMSRKSRCPICRAPIRDVVQAFPACAPPGLAAPVRNA